jgi:hypothetical protein
VGIWSIGGPSTGLSNLRGLAVFADQIFVLNETESVGPQQSITVYPVDAHGDAPPTVTISGDSTELDDPWGIAIR